MVMLMWDLEGYEDELWIVPLSFVDTRFSFLLLHNCLVFRGATEYDIFQTAKNHYNKHYAPKIEDAELKDLKEHYQNTCGSNSKGNIEIINRDNLSAIYAKKGKAVFDFPEKRRNKYNG